MGESKTVEAKYKEGDYLIKDHTLYQVSKVFKYQYSIKKWDGVEWGHATRYGVRKTDTSREWKKISKRDVKKILSDKYNLFVQEVKKLDIYLNPYMHWPRHWWTGKSDQPEGYYIGVQWTLGGASGGNCWNDNLPESDMLSAEPEEELVDLDKILEHFNPSITFLQYKRLCSEVIERGERRENEYYGNYTDRGYKIVRLRTLYNYLKAQGWLPEHLV